MITEKIKEKVIDEIFDLFTGKTKEELKEILLKDDLKRTLFKTMQEFSESNFFKHEFKDYYFNNDYKLFNHISEEKISMILPINKLEQNISEIVDVFFKSDLSYDKDTITKVIVKNYRKRASLKINLTDLFIRQEDFYLKTEEQLKNQERLLSEIKNKELEDEQYKKNIMRNEIFEDLISNLSYMSNIYLHFILKKSYTFKNLNPSKGFNLKEAIRETITNLDNHIQNDFFTIPITVTEVLDGKDIVDFLQGKGEPTKIIDYPNFCFYYFKQPICIKIEDILKKYGDLITREFKQNLLLLQKKIKSPFFFTGIEIGVCFNTPEIDFDLSSLKSILKEIGEILINLFTEIGY